MLVNFPHRSNQLVVCNSHTFYHAILYTIIIINFHQYLVVYKKATSFILIAFYDNGSICFDASPYVKKSSVVLISPLWIFIKNIIFK